MKCVPPFTSVLLNTQFRAGPIFPVVGVVGKLVEAERERMQVKNPA